MMLMNCAFVELRKLLRIEEIRIEKERAGSGCHTEEARKVFFWGVGGWFFFHCEVFEVEEVWSPPCGLCHMICSHDLLIVDP
jgi:hypothetical protein